MLKYVNYIEIKPAILPYIVTVLKTQPSVFIAHNRIDLVTYRSPLWTDVRKADIEYDEKKV